MKSKYFTITIVIISFLLAVPLFAQSDIPQRGDIEDEYKWNLEDIYPNIEQWEEDYKFVEANLKRFDAFRDKLGKSGETIYKCFSLDEKISKLLENLYVYAYLNKDSDTRVSEYQGLADRAASLNIKYSETVAFVEPELQKISEKKSENLFQKLMV